MLDFKTLSDEDLARFIRGRIANFEERRMQMVQSMDYYNYKHDILTKQRLAIGENGRVVKLFNLPNSQIIDNQYAKVLDQKVNYLFSKLPSVECEDMAYQEAITDLYDKRFLRIISKLALDAYLCGIAWLYVYPDEDGGLGLKKMDSREMIPIWEDSTHESLQALIRSYTVQVFEEGRLTEKHRVAFYTENGVQLYDNSDGKLEKISEEAYIHDTTGRGYSFGKIPFIYFKSNSQEQIFLDRCKSLQDGINTLLSNFQDNMLEDPRNTILIIKNYDGENLGEFRRNLATYGAVKVRSADGSQGGIDSLEIQVNAENYQAILTLLKEKLIENLGGADLKNQRSSQAPNELNIKAMYADMELSANQIELEFAASLEHLEYFFKAVSKIETSDISNITFKRNIMVNEESQVSMIAASYGMVSQKTLLSAHPLVSNVDRELEQLKSEREDELSDGYGLLGATGDRGDPTEREGDRGFDQPDRPRAQAGHGGH